MSRQIKFRGKRLDNGELVYGSLIRRYDRPHKVYIPFGYWIYVNENTCHEVDPETVGQYFGRLDGNSKEIYKGDIIEYSYVYNGETRKFTAYVDWSDELLGYCLRNMDGTWKSEAHSYDFEANSVIIGNIYENPKLWEGDIKDE
ncbi:YopX family protein [Paenibacillus sp. NAIST15-1]|uniref:YopX family protein n=1 Tax=Paenibacillus sp. NAIST15-1 TaxID=1605994 RepID=UPI00086DC398|nr:YopX family protein [Paenibacillus sp. NAIST15-1]GAV11459.1 Gp52 [Paenibacillus sp. NAIST15-1]